MWPNNAQLTAKESVMPREIIRTKDAPASGRGSAQPLGKQGKLVGSTGAH